MKRAAMWMLGLRQGHSPQERLAAEQELDAEDLLSRLRKDRSAVTAALMELPGIADASSKRKQAKQLLLRVSSTHLTRRDITWMRALQFCIHERTAEDSEELARLMARKEQWDFLAKRFDRLHVEAVLQELDVAGLEALYAAAKQEAVTAGAQHLEEEVAPEHKRRRLGTSPRASMALALVPKDDVNPTGLLGNQHVRQVGEVLADKLAKEKACGDQSTLASSGAAERLRDLLVELHQLCKGTPTASVYISRLASLVRSDYARLRLERWAERVDIAVLQALADECSSHVPSAALDDILEGRSFLDTAITACDFSLVLAAVVAALGERCVAAGDLGGAAIAFRRALELHPRHPSARASLVDVLLVQHTQGDASPGELLELLALEARWQTLVELYGSLGAVARDALPFWSEERLNSLAEALKEGGLSVEAASAQVCLARLHENDGRLELAYAHYRRAFALNPGDGVGEAGMCRLALSAGCVQDAATELLLKQASGSEPDRAAFRISQAVQLLAAHAESKAEDAKRDAEAAVAKRVEELEKAVHLRKTSEPEMVLDATHERLPDALPAEAARGSEGPLPASCREICSSPWLPPLKTTPPPEASSTSLALPAPQASSSNSRSDGRRLREKFPGRVPVVCHPAVTPGMPDHEKILPKMQFLVPETMPSGELKKMMHRKVALTAAGKGAALGAAGFTAQAEPVDSGASFGKLYETGAEEDACLHFRYSIERTLSGGLGVELFPGPLACPAVKSANEDLGSWDPATRTGIVRSRT